MATREPIPEPHSLGDMPMAKLPLSRWLMWVALAAALFGGLALFFRYGGGIAPALI